MTTFEGVGMARICHTRVVRRRRPDEIHRAAFDALHEIERWERQERAAERLREVANAAAWIGGFLVFGLVAWLVMGACQ